jgi:hypothetical protein
LSNLGAPPQAALRRLEDALERLENALDLPPFARQFSASDAGQCAEFRTCTQRILECREAAERVTQAGWDRVCERLIALPGPEHQGGTHTTHRRPLQTILGWIGLQRN